MFLNSKWEETQNTEKKKKIQDVFENMGKLITVLTKWVDELERIMDLNIVQRFFFIKHTQNKIILHPYRDHNNTELKKKIYLKKPTFFY